MVERVYKLFHTFGHTPNAAFALPSSYFDNIVTKEKNACNTNI